MVNFLTVTCILATWAVVVVSSAAPSAPSQPPAGAPGPAQVADCSTLIYNMIDCMTFLSMGGNETTPGDSCCSGFKTVLKANADCICYALSSSASLGLDINMTRAEALPSDCGVSASPISNCHVSTSPGGSPASSAPPSNSPTPPPATQPPAATPAMVGGPAAAPSGTASVPASQAAAPSTASSGAYAISATFSAFLVITVSLLLFNA